MAGCRHHRRGQCQDERCQGHKHHADHHLGDLVWLYPSFRPPVPEQHRTGDQPGAEECIQRLQPGEGHGSAEKDQLIMLLRPDHVGVEDFHVPHQRQGQHRHQGHQKRKRQAIAPCHGRADHLALEEILAWKGRPAFQIGAKPDQHAHTGRAEAIGPAHSLAQSTADKGREDHGDLNAQIINLESVGAPGIVFAIKIAHLCGDVALEAAHADQKAEQRDQEAGLKCIRK